MMCGPSGEKAALSNDGLSRIFNSSVLVNPAGDILGKYPKNPSPGRHRAAPKRAISATRALFLLREPRLPGFPRGTLAWEHRYRYADLQMTGVGPNSASSYPAERRCGKRSLLARDASQSVLRPANV